MDLEPLIDYLERENLGTPGVDLFRHFMPSEVEEGILVTVRTAINIDRYLGYCEGDFQVIARGKDYDQPRLFMVEVMKAFNQQGLTLGDMYFHYILPKHEPLLFPKAESDLKEVSVNFEFKFSLV